MPHIPVFPPDPAEWRFGNPYNGEPPLPRWMWNPVRWLIPEQREFIERESGHWATQRSEAMTSPADGFEVCRRLARQMYESMKARALAIPLPAVSIEPIPGKERRRREKKAKIEEELEEALAPKLTPEIEEALVGSALDLLAFRKRPPTSKEKDELIKTVIVWAEESYKIIISEDKAREIVNRAIAGLPALLPTR